MTSSWIDASDNTNYFNDNCEQALIKVMKETPV